MRKLCLSLIIAALSVLAHGQTAPVTGSITTATAGPGNCVAIRAQNNSAVGIIVSGTWSGTLTPNIQISTASGAPTIAKKVVPVDSSTAQATITANGGYLANVGGFTQFNLCATAFSAGTAVVSLYSTPAPNNSTIAGTGGGGAPSGPAGGDLGGSYPNPTVVSVADVNTGVLPAANGGSGIANTASLTLGTSPVNLATLGTGVMKNTTVTGAITDAAASDIYGLFTSCTGSSGFFLKDGGTCAAAGGITNSAGNNVIPKSNGTNIVASSVSDNGTTVSTTDTGGISATAGPVSSGSVGTAGVINLVGSTSGTASITAPAVAGTASNAASSSNNLLAPAFQFSNGTLAAGVPGVTGSASANVNFYDWSGTLTLFYNSNTVETEASHIFHMKGGNLLFVASNFTTAANTNLQTITGLSFSVPARAQNYNLHCGLSYSQATGAAAVAFGVQVASTAPTNVFVNGVEQITAGPPATFVTGTLPTLTTTTATNIVSGTPGAQGVNYTVTLDGTLELPANTNTINIMVSTATSADAVTVLRGSYCSIL